ESCNPLYVFFFFFQAEDGIRDGHVTGVQTCALPIFWKTHLPGANLFSLFMPNAMHAAWGPQITQWFYARGMNPQEEAASLGWVCLGVVLLSRCWQGADVSAAARSAPRWLFLSISATTLAMGTYLHLAQWNTWMPLPFYVWRLV